MFKNKSEIDRYNELPGKFTSDISEYETHLFGVDLYYQCIPKAVRWTNTGAFNRISTRIETALLKANRIVESHMKGEDMMTEVEGFVWPEKWGQMEERVDLCVRAYVVEIGTRGYNKRRKLSKDEIKRLKSYIAMSL